MTGSISGVSKPRELPESGPASAPTMTPVADASAVSASGVGEASHLPSLQRIGHLFKV